MGPRVVMGSNPKLSHLILGLFCPKIYVRKNSGGYLDLKLEPEPIKSQIWKIFCFPLSPTVLGSQKPKVLFVCMMPNME